MQSFKTNSREPEFSPPSPYSTSYSRSTIMPPPPPPPLLSHSLKRFVPQESTQGNRSSQNRFRKFSDDRRFVGSSHTEFIPPPPPPPVISQGSYGRNSSLSLQNKSQAQDRVLQPWHRRKGEETNIDAIRPRKLQQCDTSLDEYEKLADRSENIVQNQREIKPCVSDGDIPPYKTARKRPAEKELDETDSVNAGLPKELTKKFGPLKCNLCSVSVNSTVQASMHYSGKLHEKKVRSFLRAWAEETGEPLPKQFNDGYQRKQASEISYCEICDVALTSVAHKMQHNMGRSHRRELARRQLVSGENQQDEKNEQDLFPPYDPTGRFGIGKQFHPRDNPDVLGLMSEELNTASTSKKLICEICQVAATCKEQFAMHLKGARHRKASKLKSSVDGLPSEASQLGSLLASVAHNDESTQLASDKDYSIYRTPSGFYYCQPCNLTLNSEAQFIQHCESRKHKNKTAIAKETKQ